MSNQSSPVLKLVIADEQDPYDQFWANGEVDDFRWAFCERFMPPLTSDPRVARLKDMHDKCDFYTPNGFFDSDSWPQEGPLAFTPAPIEELLSDVYRKGDHSGERAVLTAEERALAFEVHALFTELATHYLTEFAPAQTDLIAKREFLTRIRLSETLFSPFMDALRYVWGGKTVSDFKWRN